MGISPFQFNEMAARCERNSGRNPAPSNFTPAEKETGKSGLQSEIIKWCDSQWPRWVYDFPRTDQKSTLPNGRHDSTIWGPFPKCYCIETKAKGKKRSPDQLIWETRMKALGWEVSLIYSLDEFLALVTVPAPERPA